MGVFSCIWGYRGRSPPNCKPTRAAQFRCARPQRHRRVRAPCHQLGVYRPLHLAQGHEIHPPGHRRPVRYFRSVHFRGACIDIPEEPEHPGIFPPVWHLKIPICQRGGGANQSSGAHTPGGLRDSCIPSGASERTAPTAGCNAGFLNSAKPRRAVSPSGLHSPPPTHVLVLSFEGGASTGSDITQHTYPLP